ncbi:MAG TPA: tetratricopeptide repeat protein, partial [Pyrinomonadaceae bacterium]|nr:tetratricopeptide repeat protein [Pyrinomonadaceae bacterium]
APSISNSRIPPELDRITMKALAKRPEARYQSAAEMMEDLRDTQMIVSHDTSLISRLKEDPHRTGEPGSPRRTNRSNALTSLTQGLRRPRVSLGFVIIAVLATGLVLMAIIYWQRPGQHKVSTEAQGWYDRGMTALSSGAYFQASKAMAKAVEMDDNFAMAHARLAEAWMEMGYADNAKDEMLRVSALVPDRSVLAQTDALYLEAINALVSNDFTRAILAYGEILRLTPDHAQAYVDLGRAYEKNEELGKAIENYVQATNRDAQNALAYLRVGVLYGREQNTASALAAFDKAKAVYDPSTNIEGQASVLYERGYLLINARKLDEARDQLQQALDLATASGHDAQKIGALLQLSRLSYTEGSLGKAQSYANEAINYAQQRGLNDLLALGLKNLGYTLFVNGNYDEAEKTYNRALEFAKRNKSRLREAEILQNLASLYIQQLRTDEGLQSAKDALTFFEQGGYRSNVHTCLSLLGRVERRKGDYESALVTFQRTLDLANESGYQPQIAFSLGEIATVLAEQERYPEALARYEQSYQINRALNDRLGMAYKLMDRGNVEWRLGRYDEARASLAQAYELANQPESSFKPVLAEVTLRQAEIELSEGHLPVARTKIQQALELAGTGYEGVPVQARFTLGLVLAAMGSAREGKKECQEAVEMATRAGDAALISRAKLSLAQTLLAGDDAQGALKAALEAQERFKDAGQLESEWRAWVVAARASRLKRDDEAARSQLSHAAEVLARLRESWGDEYFATYLTRPDIQVSHKQVGDAVPNADH